MNELLLRNAYSLHQAGDLNEAARLYGEILRNDPQQLDALSMLGLLHGQRGEFADAQRIADAATQIESKSSRALFNLGCLLQNLGRYEEALTRYDRALSIQPVYPTASINRGIALTELDRHEDALASFDKALALAPLQPDALFRRCGALLRLKRHRDALAAIDRYLSLWPNNPEAWISRGSAFFGLKDFENASASFAKALELKPDHAVALSSHAGMLTLMNRYEEAILQYQALLKLDADFPYALGNILDCRLRCCDWRFLEEETAMVATALRAGKRVIQPLVHLAISRSPAEQLQCARIGAAELYPATPAPLWRGERYRHDRIRIAYISEDFRNHAVSFLMAGVWENHDRARFETVALSYGPDDASEMARRARDAFERFIDVQNMKDFEVAALIRQMEIDLVVDLMGFSGHSRPGILALHAAPVQVNYLGYPATVGAEYIDYILADRIVIPSGERIHYSEKVVYLPDTYLPNDSHRPIAAYTPTRAEAGLPENGFVFCCFNAALKLGPEIFGAWMRLLKTVENSALWLSELGPLPVQNLRREAALQGVAPERLIFAPFLDSQEQYLARLRLADLFLDTLPYNAHTTASDALWAGVPVLTCRGATFAGRVAASLLAAIGLSELIAPSLDAYERRARELAEDASALAAIKAKLARNRDTHPLFDTARITRHLEAAYTGMWERQQRGERPTSFAVGAGAPVAP